MVRRAVAVLLHDRAGPLDAAGPLAVFEAAGRLSAPRAFEVLTVGDVGGPRRPATPDVPAGVLPLVPDHGLDDCPAVEVLVVPGGPGLAGATADERLLGWLRERAGEVEALLTVGTGALLLAAAGLLHRRRAVTHHDAVADLARLDPALQVVQGQRFLRSGERLWTSGGASAGVDLALHLVGELVDRHLRDAVVADLEWGWRS